MNTVSGICMCHRCKARTGNIYRMIGRCSNCGADPILMLFRAGDRAIDLDCPGCRCYWTVKAYRRATDDEFPEARLNEAARNE